ncbi:ABC transporter substrate-binding protein [Bacillus sp. 165]|uniref:ABC transporter substrate-binding protein n=1 Tax=Bacillus sp. 165 TaxID=1529117 RepID=UPI001AD9D25F|nr:ABC transporter substrate-binding protein [Bacillus sp. 165]MBO9129437.1 ABC transporter substrate-binding protein [Bacillus sp. 165]
MGVKKYKKIAAASLIAGAVLMSAACSNESASKKVDGNGNKDEISISFRSGGGANKGLTEWLEQEVIPEFKKDHPNAKIKLAPLNVSEGDYFAKIALMLKSKNTAPDIVTEDTFMVNSDASAGYLEPLDDEVKEWDEWSQFTENVKNGVIAQDGKVYGVPYNTDSRGLWYNKALFKQAGLPVPWEPKTWDDILLAAKTIKEKLPSDVIPLWMNSGKATGEATSMQTFEMLLYGTKTPLYDNEAKKWIVKSDGLLHTFQFIDAVYEQKLGPNLSQVLNGQGSTLAYQQLMPKGKLAIGLDGIWQTGNWRTDGPAPWAEAFDTIGFAPMPTETGDAPGTVTMSGGWALSIPKNSDNKELAWEFIKFASSKENNLKLQMKDRSLTTRDDVANDPQYQEIPMFKEATAMLKTAQFRPAVDKYPTVSTEIQALVEDVVTGKLTAEQAAEQYQKNVTSIVGKENVIEK